MFIVMEFLCLIFRQWNVGIIILTMMMMQITSGLDLTNTLNIRKCHCDKFQALNGTTCYESNTVLHIYNNTLKHEFDIQKYGIAVLTSTVEKVSVMELECPDDLFRTTLTTHYIILLPDGSLLWKETMKVFTNDVFCVKHILEDGQIYFDADVCLPPPDVPHCCPNSHVLDQGGCRPRENLQPPPLYLKNHRVNWDQVDGNMETPSCSEHEDLRQIHIKPGEAQLDDAQPTASLHWEPQQTWVPFPSWKNKYCVALQETEAGDLEYVAQICWKDHSRYYQDQCNNSVCINKCCIDGAILSEKHGCLEAFGEEKWVPSQMLSQEMDQELKILYGEPGCQEVHKFSRGMNVLPDGSLQLAGNMAPPVLPSRYCFDNLLMDDGSITYNVAMVCAAEEKCKWRDTLIKVTVGISCIWLIVTLGVYLGVV